MSEIYTFWGLLGSEEFKEEVLVFTEAQRSKD
jgi:hypothetical protein